MIEFDSKLSLYREEINNLDEVIIESLFKRFEITHEIGILKKDHSEDILQSKREQEIIGKIHDNIKNDSSKIRERYVNFINSIYLTIMEQSRLEQK